MLKFCLIFVLYLQDLVPKETTLIENIYQKEGTIQQIMKNNVNQTTEDKTEDIRQSNLNIIDPRFSATYGNQHLRAPSPYAAQSLNPTPVPYLSQNYNMSPTYSELYSPSFSENSSLSSSAYPYRRSSMNLDIFTKKPATNYNVLKRNSAVLQRDRGWNAFNNPNAQDKSEQPNLDFDEEEILTLEATSPLSSVSSQTMKIAIAVSPQPRRMSPILQSPASLGNSELSALVEESPIKVINYLLVKPPGEMEENISDKTNHPMGNDLSPTEYITCSDTSDFGTQV